tara:strand:- start:17064 stop:17924 length:861 start_codon:yes stop_codon:yes gene_type:complete
MLNIFLYKLNILGIDFEDWYHPHLIQKYNTKKNCEPKIINGIDKIIDLLRINETSATFFMVGELLEFEPTLLDKILENGHEIAFHTMHHTKIDDKNFQENFPNELEHFSKLTNHKSKGFRAPTFSLNENSSWIIDFLAKNNYQYDSSVVPAKSQLYGLPNAEKKPYRTSTNCFEKNSPDGKLIEFPLLVTKFFGKTIPAGGGFYLRFLPLNVIKNAIKNYEKQNMPATFYIHSWELTPEFMPKIKLPFKDNFITYHNLDSTFKKTESLLKKFKFTSFENFLFKNII